MRDSNTYTYQLTRLGEETVDGNEPFQCSGSRLDAVGSVEEVWKVFDRFFGVMKFNIISIQSLSFSIWNFHFMTISVRSLSGFEPIVSRF